MAGQAGICGHQLSVCACVAPQFDPSLLDGTTRTLLDDYDYVMHGRVFQLKSDGSTNVYGGHSDPRWGVVGGWVGGLCRGGGHKRRGKSVRACRCVGWRASLTRVSGSQ